MGSIIYLIGRSVDARQCLLARKMASREPDSALHLVPTRGRVMELEIDPRFWLTKRVDTLTRIIHQIFEENIRPEQFEAYKPIDDALQSLLVKKILEKRGTEPDGLSYFSRLLENRNQKIQFPGIYRTLSNFFSFLIRNNFQDSFVQELAGRIIRFEEKSPGMGEERYALESDLTWLFGDYEEIKREIRVYDEDDILSSVRSYLKNGGIPRILTNMDILIFDGFIHLSRIEEDILFYCFHQAEEVWWLLDYDSQCKDPVGDFKEAAGREARWHWVDKGRSRGHEQLGRHEAYQVFISLVSLMERLDRTGFDSRIEKATEEPFRNPVAGGLYSHGHMDESSCESLKIRSFANRADEVRAIAGEIKRIIRDNNLNPRRDLGKIRVIFPDLKDYSSLIFEIFSEYEIPFSLTKGLPLSSHPISNIFLYILGLPLNNFSREGIFNLFSSSMIKGSSREEEPEEELDWFSRINDEFLLAEEDPSEIKKSIQEGLEGGNKDGLDIFLFDEVARKVGLNNLGIPLSGLWERLFLRVKNYYSDQYHHAKDAGKRKELIHEYYRFFAQISMLENRLSLFENLAKQNNPRGVEACLFRILDMLGFPENIVNISEEISGSEPAVIRAMMKRDIKAYSTLKDLILASADEAHIESTLFRIKEGYSILSRFYSIFEQRLNSAYLLDERNPNVVRISEWLEIRGRSFDYIFAGGLIADKFPLREEVDFILPETPSTIFRMKDLISQSKHLFVHLLRNYRKGFYLSYPRYTEEKEKMPTPVLTDLESMVKSGRSLEGGREILEEVFKWEQNRYFTSREELLNATFTKNKISEGKRDHFFPLNRIIFRHNKVDKRLIRGINALRSRWASDGLFEYDGLVGGSVRVGEFLKGRSDIFSPSQLETLANCPMRYLFEHIYGLKTMEELGEEVSSRDMGKHIHSILKNFFQRLKNEGKSVADIGLDRAFSLALEVADEYFMNHPFLNMLEFFDFQKKEFLAGLEQNRIGSTGSPDEREGIFAQLLRFEEREFRDNIPGGLEYRFGQEGKPPVLFGGTRIKGYIDRFDMVKGEEEMVHVYDYKTGITPTSDMGKKGLSFQLPAYIVALKASLQIKKISASFYSLKRELFLKENPLKQRINDHCEGFPGLDVSGVSIIGDYVDQLIKIFGKGRFHQSADEMICLFCQFKYACFKDMRRINHLLDSNVDHQIYSGKKNLERWRDVDEFRKGWKAVSQSMKKALTLKTESGRRKHFESVMDYRRWLKENRDSLPLEQEYVEELLGEIDVFEEAYRKKETANLR